MKCRDGLNYLPIYQKIENILTEEELETLLSFINYTKGEMEENSGRSYNYIPDGKSTNTENSMAVEEFSGLH